MDAVTLSSKEWSMGMIAKEHPDVVHEHADESYHVTKSFIISSGGALSAIDSVIMFDDGCTFTTPSLIVHNSDIQGILDENVISKIRRHLMALAKLLGELSNE